MIDVSGTNCSPTDDDLRWVEERIAVLLRDGLSILEATDRAARERAEDIVRNEARVQRDADRAKLRANGELGRRPTLTTSFGDLLRKKP